MESFSYRPDIVVFLLLSWHFCHQITRSDPSTSLILFKVWSCFFHRWEVSLSPRKGSQATPHDFGQSLVFRTANICWDFLRSHKNVKMFDSLHFQQKKLRGALSKTLAAVTTKKWNTIYMAGDKITHPQNHQIEWGNALNMAWLIYAGHRGIYNSIQQSHVRKSVYLAQVVLPSISPVW